MAALDQDFEGDLDGERTAYLRELTTTLEEVEALVLELGDADGAAGPVRALARQIHTIKGTAGSLGLDLLSLTAHRMEDLLAERPPDQKSDEKFIDRLLAQNDLLGSIAKAYLDKNTRALEEARCRLEPSSAAPCRPPDRNLTPEVRLKRVLIVEPSVAALQFCVNALRSIGAPEVSSACDGYEALGLLLKEKFDAVITSLQLPTIDGQSLAATLRIVPGPNTATPVILLTSSASALDPAKASPDFLVEKKVGWAEELSATLRQITRCSPPSLREVKKASLKKILLIDDSREIHVLAQLAFKRFPEIQLIGLQDPQQALDRARREQPDLILLDVQMAPISGKDVMRSLRAVRELCEIPVAFFTGTDDENETRELMALGAWQIFQKPFSPKTFADRVLSRFQER
jgi:CheY-like chemotaxis protein/HPt (histidine-containing phosphotransfer) domain-containing protein